MLVSKDTQMRFRALWLALIFLCVGGIASAQQVPADSFNAPGAYTLGFMIAGLERQIHVYIPPSYDPAVDAPLVLVLHGAGGTGIGTASFTGFADLADEQGFILVFPDGFQRAWNDARPDIRTITTDDVGFIRNILDFLTENLSVDERRIYAAGYSMGGGMAFRLGCQLQDRFAAVASVAFTFPAYQLDACLFSEPIPVMLVQGTNDTAYAGYTDQYGNRLMMSVDESRRYWARHNGCEGDTLTSSMPDIAPDDGTRIRLRANTDCENHADVVIYEVRGGGHTWPGRPLDIEADIGHTSMDIDATRVIWQFFEQHAKEE
jgi:polyhydroxybutyrate depolymerase